MNNILATVDKYVKTVSRSGINVSEAILFGSWARGSARPDSDIDVCIVSPALGKDWVAETVNLRRLAFDIDARIEPMPFGPDDISDRFNPLAQEINKYGIRITAPLLSNPQSFVSHSPFQYYSYTARGALRRGRRSGRRSTGRGS